ncbi:cyclin-SDS-like isoform X1 [Typha angustifolia]|uniref:cyclin-SDS-like isoform X1 n=1 Tax=Typha angustifolia TaxID=59011 RepID=UPI003C2E2CE9
MLAAHPNLISDRPLSGRKRPIGEASRATKLRSKIPRRRRIPLFPKCKGASSADDNFNVAEEPAESSSSCLCSEISTGSRSENPNFQWASSRPRKVNDAAILISGSGEFRRITRSFSRKQAEIAKRLRKEENTSNSAVEIAGSDVSEVVGGFPNGNFGKKGKEMERFLEISESSCLESISDAKATRIPNSIRDLDLDSDLACSEQFSDDESSNDSTSNEKTLPEYEAELFQPCLEEDDFSDNSLVVSSCSSDFSDRSREASAAPSATFSLILELAQHFMRSTGRENPNAAVVSQDECSQEFTVMRFEEEDEESYKRFRSREKKEAWVYDYGEEYGSMTEDSRLIFEQRLVMVNWMVEHCKAVELQDETLFLGVGLLDRFLSRGYFKSVKNLQLLGISCITLATRIEENQPYNSIRQRTFKVGNNAYSRSEVVAMEWVVQEVLNFQCFLPTIHNFIWFYLKAARANAEVEDLSRSLAVLSLLDHERLAFWPSTVAAGLVILACLATNHDSSCHMVMETHVRTKNDDLPECIKSLEWLIKYAC